MPRRAQYQSMTCCARPHPRHRGRLPAELAVERVVVLLDPVGQCAAEVHQRVADRRHLPVEHAGDPQVVVRVEHQVVEAPVVVDQALAEVGRLVPVEPRGELAPVAEVVGGGSAQPVGPAGHLTRDVPLAAAERCQVRDLPTSTSWRRTSASHACSHRVDGTRRRELEGQVLAQDHAVEPLHDVEVGAQHGLVRAQADHARDVRVDRPERVLDEVLATHVVRAARLRPDRRPTKDQLVRVVGRARSGHRSR